MDSFPHIWAAFSRTAYLASPCQRGDKGRDFEDAGGRLRNTPLEEPRHRFQDPAVAQVLNCIQGSYSCMHENTRVAVTRHRTSGTAVPLHFETLKCLERPDWLRPRFASPYIEIPIYIKVFVATDTGKDLVFAQEVATDFSKAGGGIEYRKFRLKPFYGIEHLNQFSR
jgi:hypothetical protein